MCITLRSTTSIWAFLRQFHANKVELLPAVYVSGEVPSHSRKPCHHWPGISGASRHASSKVQCSSSEATIKAPGSGIGTAQALAPQYVLAKTGLFQVDCSCCHRHVFYICKTVDYDWTRTCPLPRGTPSFGLKEPLWHNKTSTTRPRDDTRADRQ
ncbi:hypothetical protein OH76DRAFT_1034225 [Lentinus brumalis]|uniref:Uncharacterized protein n=1 Tax=Lentinus brumalis TaxID=2498619 RepID=A0A371CX33_9APHY|nr:hypothetical protein OH76DRAFT_1034225 [Polyporus brumalis]